MHRPLTTDQDEVTDSGLWLWQSHRSGDWGWWRWVDAARVPDEAGREGGMWSWRSIRPEPNEPLSDGEFIVAPADATDEAIPGNGEGFYWWEWHAFSGSECDGPAYWERRGEAHGALSWASTH